jgi:hypothetical protein
MSHPSVCASFMDLERLRPVACRFMDDEHWVPTGTKSRVLSNTDRVPAFDGEHLWTWIAVFRASACAEQPTLDGKSLLRIAGINCYYCKMKYRAGGSVSSLCSGPVE